MNTKGKNHRHDGSDVRLPKWDAVHVELSTNHVDRSFLEEAAEKMGSGYFVVEDGEEDDTYLLVSHRGMICEVGALETEEGRRNLGKAFERVTLVDVERALNGTNGTVSAYSLPENVCVSLCGVINGRTRYGDLNTKILELEDLLERLAEDGFTGSIVFTSEDEYALLEYEDGERVDFGYEGDAEIEEPEDLADETLGRMEANVFEPREEIDAPKPMERDEDKIIDYDGIADALADATGRISSRERFHDALEEQMEPVEDAEFKRGDGTRGVVTRKPDESDVFEAYRKAVEASAEIVPPSKVYEEAHDEIEDMEGGERFLRVVY